MSYRYYKGFKQQKWPWNSLKVIGNMPFDRPYMISYLSSIVTMSLSCTVSEILLLISQNLKTSRDRDYAYARHFVISMLNHHMANQCTQFNISSFSHSVDILRKLRIKMGHVTIITPLSGSVCHRWARTSYNSYDQAVYQILNLYECTFTHYEYMKGDKINTVNGVVWGLGVTQGYRQHNHSIEHI